jgi:flagellum-specific peptidoglycan hydrolase FlgJ
MTPDEYLEMVTEPAKQICDQYNLPYACCVAQGALESQWGTYGIGNGGYNLFGRKYGGQGDYVEVETQEDDGTGNLYTISAKFQSYNSIDEAIKDWCELMLWGPYRQYAIQYQSDHYLKGFVEGIASIYATDVFYADKIMQTIRACELT